EAEHQAAEVSARRFRSRHEGPEVLALVEGPVDRQDPEEEREGLRDRERAGPGGPHAPEGRGQDRDERDEDHEHDAPVPPDPDEMVAGHEARIGAAVRPDADAGREATEYGGHAPLHLHPRAEAHLAEAGRHRRLEAVETGPEGRRGPGTSGGRGPSRPPGSRTSGGPRRSAGRRRGPSRPRRGRPPSRPPRASSRTGTRGPRAGTPAGVRPP